MDDKLKNNLQELVRLSIKSLIEEACLHPFDNEIEVHGYLRCLLRSNMRKLNIELPIEHEYKTHLFYHRESNINDGFLYHSVKYNSLIQNRRKPKRGQIDLALLHPNDYISFQYQEHRVKQALIGIELQLPRGKGRNEAKFKKHVIVDCKKLTDTDNKIDLKYLICFVYNRLDFDAIRFFDKDLKKEISKYDELNLAFFEINSEEIRYKISPINWLG